jgi:hypothetical protein
MRLTSLALLAIAAPVAQAQQPSVPPAASGGTTTGTKVAIRPLGAIVATATDSLGVVGGVRALPGGRVLVNDMARRRVLLFDASLANPTVVVDSAAGAVNSYGPRGGGLIPYRGDSTLFVDPTSLSMLVIDPAGSVARVMSVPRSDDAASLASGVAGTPGFDAQGRLVYRGFPRVTFDRRGGGQGAARSGGSAVVVGGLGGAMPTPPDTTPIVRVDLATRVVDTVGFVKVARPNINVSTDSNGQPQISMTMNPLPTVDEWAVTSDGAIAIVRGRDYHVDWVNPDGSRSASAKLPFDWKRMTDEDKETFLDSLKAVRARQGPNAPMPFVAGMGGGAAPQVMTRMEVREGGPPGGGGAPPRSETRISNSAPTMEFVPASQLPDYRPPFFAGAVRADRDGNVWIRTTAAPTEAGATVWDVVDRKGTIVDRVQVPGGRTIVGFGADGTALLAVRDGSNTKLEKAKLR